MSKLVTQIPFHKPFCSSLASAYMQTALESGKWAGNGPFGQRCRQILSQLHNSASIFLTPSCTSALEMAAVILQIQPGDEVIVPAYTFVSSASAFALFGARPVFVDVDPRTLNLDSQKLEAAITPKTRAIVPVHYAGVACDMKTIMEIAQSHKIEVVEDAAHALFASSEGRPLGTFGSMATLSFHETKNVSCGEGGALIINRPDWVERAEIAQEKGTDRSRFLMGLVDKYTWVAPGSSYLLSEINAALLCANLEQAEQIQRQRLALWDRYHQELRAWCQRHGIQQPHLPEHSQQPAHLYFLLLPDVQQRQSLTQHLRRNEILAAHHYQALNTSPMAQRYGATEKCPVAESVAHRILRLPLYANLSFEEQDRILEVLNSWSPP